MTSNHGAAVGGRTVRVCAGTACVATGSLDVMAAFEQALARRPELDVEVQTSTCLEGVSAAITGCHGFCGAGPLVKIPELDLMYCLVSAADVPEIVDRTLGHGEVVERLVYHDPETGRALSSEAEIPFFAKQHRTALHLCGEIDPESIDDSINHGGYKAVERVLASMTPADVIVEIKRSGLAGRGGGGFPTGLKWQLVAERPGHIKYIVCNGDEGDPGAFMDRSVMEGDPHSVIEGLAIAAFAIGARHGFLYVRAEYRLAVDRLRMAVVQAQSRGFLGERILGSAFDFDITVVEGAGAFVCGEESALLNSIEGYRAVPRPRPPYPAVRGLWGCPTLINNVETLANVPGIITYGGAEFARFGTPLAKGTKTFALTGGVNNIGLVEVPMGISLREIIFGIGGGMREGREFKAAQTGGPSGGCIPASQLDTPIDFKSLLDLGSMMGSGGMVVVDDTTCMVKLARFFIEFCVEESCGKCPPCRIGTQVLLNILDRICNGEGEVGDVERMEHLADHIKRTSLCGLGQTAPNPILSTIRHFRGEYDAHIDDRKCPAGECAQLVEFFVDAGLCHGCSLCTEVCPVEAIAGIVDEPHMIDGEVCTHCGACVDVCPNDAVRTR